MIPLDDHPVRLEVDIWNDAIVRKLASNQINMISLFVNEDMELRLDASPCEFLPPAPDDAALEVFVACFVGDECPRG